MSPQAIHETDDTTSIDALQDRILANEFLLRHSNDPRSRAAAQQRIRAAEAEINKKLRSMH